MTTAVMPTYGRADLSFERGSGAYLFASDGRRFLDFASGVAVTGLGHAHPHLVKALTEQAQKVWHTSNVFRIPGQERLAQRLTEVSFAETVFFANSGAEAIECGLKMIRKYHDDTGHPERYRVITCSGAFHGRTLATISAGGQEKHLQGFMPEVDGFDHVAFGNLNELRAAIGPQTAAVLVEPVQGEGGMRAASVEYLRALRQVCDEYGLLLFFDEIQCGMGRTGKLFAHEWAGVAPDVMGIAKALGGGFPVSACLATRRAAVGMTQGTHGSTFGGNPLAMAVGNAVLDVMLAPGFLENVQRSADRLRGELELLARRHPSMIEEIRGKGLMIGLKLGVPNTEMQTRLREQGLLTVTAGDNVLRLLPPLIIGEPEIAEAIAILQRVLSGWTATG
jgi:acetylornithine/N-succinyldiaminopimelate aminotransferase